MYLARRKDVARKASHPLKKIAQMILLRVDRPDDVAHCLDQLVRDGGYLRQWLCEASIVAVHLLLCDFAEDDYLREARAYVVVQVCGYARAHALQLAQAFFARSEQCLLCLLALYELSDLSANIRH